MTVSTPTWERGTPGILAPVFRGLGVLARASVLALLCAYGLFQVYLTYPVPRGGATEIVRGQGAAQTRSLDEWAAEVEDPRLITALTVAYTQLDWWRPVAQELARRRTRFVVEPHPGTAAVYALNRIAVAPGLLNEPIAVQVAVLVHESWHATSSYEHIYFSPISFTPQGGALCFDEEIAAARWANAAYRAIGRPDGAATTPLTRAFDEGQRYEQEGRFPEFVLGNSGYQEECLGRQVS